MMHRQSLSKKLTMSDPSTEAHIRTKENDDNVEEVPTIKGCDHDVKHKCLCCNHCDLCAFGCAVDEIPRADVRVVPSE